MNPRYTFILLLLLPFMANAQLGNLLNKAKNKVQQRVDNKVDKSIDQVLDKAEGKETESQQPAAIPVSREKAPETNETLASYSRYDFSPGEKVVYAEDFAQETIGELPVNWNTGGKAELVTLNKFPGKWLRLYQNALYLTSSQDTFSRNFTIEFDVIFQLQSTGYSFPYFSFGFMSSNGEPANDNKFLDQPLRYAAAQVYTRLGAGKTTTAYVESHLDGRRHFITESQPLSLLENYYHQVTHVSMQIQDKRWRVWFNGEKKFDLPMALPTAYLFNQLFFKVHHSSYKENELGFYIGNLKVAAGKPDTRHRLVEEGKFSTTGILFDFQSATLKQESYGVLREIASVLKEHGKINIKIIGHTSSDGDDAANMELSRKRAAAVKQALVQEFQIEEARLQTEGKGETQPVADNKTKEGKIQNRRVEFIKL